MKLNESIVEDAALTWFWGLGYTIGHGPYLSRGEWMAERDSECWHYSKLAQSAG